MQTARCILHTLHILDTTQVSWPVCPDTEEAARTLQQWISRMRDRTSDVLQELLERYGLGDGQCKVGNNGIDCTLF